LGGGFLLQFENFDQGGGSDGPTDGSAGLEMQVIGAGAADDADCGEHLNGLEVAVIMGNIIEPEDGHAVASQNALDAAYMGFLCNQISRLYTEPD
jgi:hypothetical protein